MLGHRHRKRGEEEEEGRRRVGRTRNGGSGSWRLGGVGGSTNWGPVGSVRLGGFGAGTLWDTVRQYAARVCVVLDGGGGGGGRDLDGMGLVMEMVASWWAFLRSCGSHPTTRRPPSTPSTLGRPTEEGRSLSGPLSGPLCILCSVHWRGRGGLPVFSRITLLHARYMQIC